MQKRPRVKLVTIPWELEVPTLTLASIAAVTPKEIDVCIVDLLRERLNLDEPVDLVAISASTPKINAAYALADLYRAKGVKVVIGGHHVTALPDEGLQHADAVVCGEGEGSWIRICDELLTRPSKIGGAYREPPPDLATLPQPRIDLMKIERYSSLYYPVIASRGCPESCSFCFAKKMTQGYRTYPISHVIEQVRRRPSFVRSMYFVDDNLPADFDYARELFRELAKYKVPFGMQARHEFSADPDNLERAREAGCLLISSGYESVNQMSLDKTGKRASVDDYLDRIHNIFQAGIIPSGNWMFGFDWDTPDVFDRTLEFLDRSDMIHCSFTTEIPFPGTEIWKRYRREGRLVSENYDDYVGKDHVVVHPKQMTPEQLREGIRRLTLGFYSPRRAVRRSVRGLANEKLARIGPNALRAPMLLFANAYQVYQWHYRMAPSMQWLYQRLLDVNKHLYLADYLTPSNFKHRPFRRADQRAGTPEAQFDTDSAFLHQEGFKPNPHRPLEVVSRPSTPRPAVGASRPG